MEKITWKHILSILAVLGLAIFCGVVFMELAAAIELFVNYLNISSFEVNYWAETVIIIALALALFYPVYRIKINKEIKAAIAVIPLTTTFISFVFAMSILLPSDSKYLSESTTNIIFDISSFIPPVIIIFYLIRKKKNWLYIESAVIALSALILFAISLGRM